MTYLHRGIPSGAYDMNRQASLGLGPLGDRQERPPATHLLDDYK